MSDIYGKASEEQTVVDDVVEGETGRVEIHGHR